MADIIELVGSEPTNVNIEKVQTNVKAVNANMEEKADKQWMPNGWKIESDLPATYTRGSTTLFRATTVFGGLASGAIVETKIGLNGLGIQYVYRTTASPIKYRLITDTDAWGAWQTIAASVDLEQITPIVIGGSNNIKLIGEITNYTTYNGFNLEAMLHNIYLKQGSQLSNAFLTVGKYNNSFPIEGKMQILNDYVNITTANRSIIRITDTGKIYSVNNIYSEATSWNIIKKTNNVIIYNNPAVVSSIEDNVIWDSELNKTNLATTEKIDISSTDLRNGWSLDGVGVVLKNGNVVNVNITIRNGTATAGTIVANIPSGFRPKNSRYLPVTIFNATIVEQGVLEFATNGDIKITRNFTTGTVYFVIDVNYEVA